MNCLTIVGVENLPLEDTLLIHYTINCTGTWDLLQLSTAYRGVCDNSWTIMYPDTQHPRHTDLPITVYSPPQAGTFAWDYGGIRGIVGQDFSEAHSYLTQLSVYNLDCGLTGTVSGQNPDPTGQTGATGDPGLPPPGGEIPPVGGGPAPGAPGSASPGAPGGGGPSNPNPGGPGPGPGVPNPVGPWTGPNPFPTPPGPIPAPGGPSSPPGGPSSPGPGGPGSPGGPSTGTGQAPQPPGPGGPGNPTGQSGVPTGPITGTGIPQPSDPQIPPPPPNEPTIPNPGGIISGDPQPPILVDPDPVPPSDPFTISYRPTLVHPFETGTLPRDIVTFEEPQTVFQAPTGRPPVYNNPPIYNNNELISDERAPDILNNPNAYGGQNNGFLSRTLLSSIIASGNNSNIVFINQALLIQNSRVLIEAGSSTVQQGQSVTVNAGYLSDSTEQVELSIIAVDSSGIQYLLAQSGQGQAPVAAAGTFTTSNFALGQVRYIAVVTSGGNVVAYAFTTVTVVDNLTSQGGSPSNMVPSQLLNLVGSDGQSDVIYNPAGVSKYYIYNTTGSMSFFIDAETNDFMIASVSDLDNFANSTGFTGQISVNGAPVYPLYHNVGALNITTASQVLFQVFPVTAAQNQTNRIYTNADLKPIVGTVDSFVTNDVDLSFSTPYALETLQIVVRGNSASALPTTYYSANEATDVSGNVTFTGVQMAEDQWFSLVAPKFGIYNPGNTSVYTRQIIRAGATYTLL